MASNTSALRIAGSHRSSTRLSSISIPAIGRSIVETGLGQHPGEHVQPAAHLLPVPHPVGPGELPCVDLFSHGPILA